MTGPSITVDQDFPLSFESFLFNEPMQIRNQGGISHTFHYIDKGVALARCTIFLDSDEARSPLRAPFGSIEFEPSLKFSELSGFIKYIIDFCRTKGLKRIRMVSYPLCYSPHRGSMLTYGLLEQGFTIAVSDLNFHLQTSGHTFEASLHQSELRRLKKCDHHGFTSKVDPYPDLEEIHSLVRANRALKGFPVSMTVSDLENSFMQFPDRFTAFTYRDGKKLIASAIGVRISSAILYYFLPATDSAYNNFSPIVAVIREMFGFCRDRGYEMLDLGIATAHGFPNEGLVRFKQNLGAKSSLKLSFVKEL